MTSSRGFEYWEDFEAAQRAKGQANVDAMQDKWQELLQNKDVTAYQQACIEYYSQVDFKFPDDLAPCMYTLYIKKTEEFLTQRGGSFSTENGVENFDEESWQEFLTIQATAPYANNYMDEDLARSIDNMFDSYAMAHGIPQ